MVDVILTTAALLPSTMVVKSGSVCTAAGRATWGCATCACATCVTGVAAPACEEGKSAAPAQYPPAMSAAAAKPAKANFAFMGTPRSFWCVLEGTDRVEGA